MCILRYTRPFHNIWQWWHHCIEVKLACSMIDIIIYSKNRLMCYLINAYPLSLKMRISCMEPKLAKVFCSSSSERPFAMPPQYTVQLVGLDWLYTSSKVKGLELAAKINSYVCKVWLLRCRQLSTPKLFWGGDNGRKIWLYMSTVYTQQFFGWVLTTFLLNKPCLEKILFSKIFALASLALGDCSTPEHFLGVDSVCTCQILGWG